jgi:hypothetical protein
MAQGAALVQTHEMTTEPRRERTKTATDGRFNRQNNREDDLWPLVKRSAFQTTAVLLQGLSMLQGGSHQALKPHGKLPQPRGDPLEQSESSLVVCGGEVAWGPAPPFARMPEVRTSF